MGIVYVLTNEAMPGFVKIGHTSQAIEARMRSLNGTGMPYPFECVAAWEFRDAPGVEATLHRAFADRRVSRSREFFKMDPDKAVVLLERFGRRNVTPSAKKAGKRRKAPDESKPRRGNFKFTMIAGMEPGSAAHVSVGRECDLHGGRRPAGRVRGRDDDPLCCGEAGPPRDGQELGLRGRSGFLVLR